MVQVEALTFRSLPSLFLVKVKGALGITGWKDLVKIPFVADSQRVDVEAMGVD